MPDQSEDRHRRYIRAQKTIDRTRRLRHLSWSLRPLGRGAVLYVGGAFWADPGSLPFYEYAVRRGADLAVFVHDMIPVTYPQFVDGGALPAFERLLRLPFAAVANSNYTRDDIRRAAAQIARALQPDPIDVVRLAQEYSGWDRNGRVGAPPSPRFEQLGSARLALCVGTVEIRKNHAALLLLWASVWAEHGDRLPRLVVAGRRGWMAEKALHLLDAAEVGGPFLFVEAPSDAELAWLYAQCEFTVFPSMVEGWGLPVGESLWFGKPCVASSATAIPEVGGALCDYGDPYDIDSFGQAILRFGLDAHALRARSAEIQAAPLRRWHEVSAEVTDTVRTLAARATERSNRGGGARL
jgi:glycosyltransferase involved in cell wall biosynthesis